MDDHRLRGGWLRGVERRSTGLRRPQVATSRWWRFEAENVVSIHVFVRFQGGRRTIVLSTIFKLLRGRALSRRVRSSGQCSLAALLHRLLPGATCSAFQARWGFGKLGVGPLTARRRPAAGATAIVAAVLVTARSDGGLRIAARETEFSRFGRRRRRFGATFEAWRVDDESGRFAFAVGFATAAQEIVGALATRRCFEGARA